MKVGSSRTKYHTRAPSLTDRPGKAAKKDRRKERRERFLGVVTRTFDDATNEVDAAKRRAEGRMPGLKHLERVIATDVDPSSALGASPSKEAHAKPSNVQQGKQGTEEEDASKLKHRPRSRKHRHRQEKKDVPRISRVLAHPSFQADPFAAIQAHLKNAVVNGTIPARPGTADAIIRQSQAEEQDQQRVQGQSTQTADGDAFTRRRK